MGADQEELVPMELNPVEVSGPTARAVLVPQEGYGVPVPIRGRIDDPAHGFVVEFVVDADERGQVGCTELTIQRRPNAHALTNGALAQLRIREVVAEAIDRSAFPLPQTWTPGEAISMDLAKRNKPEIPVERSRGGRGRQEIPDERLADVAQVYRSAAKYKRKAVAEAFSVSTATASRAIQRATAAGLMEDGQ